MAKKIIGLMISLMVLTGCGGGGTSSAKSKGANNNTKNNNNSSTMLEGGTINNPTQLQFEKVYNVPEAYRTYVKVTVKSFQRITFNLAVDTNNAWDYGPIKIYDMNHNSVDTYAYGDTNTEQTLYPKGIVRDIIFIKQGTYLIEFYFKASHFRWTYTDPTKCRLVAHDLGVTSLPKIKNKQTYKGGEHKYYRLEMVKDGEININGYGGAVIYDYNLNAIENLNEIRDINVTLPKGDYLFNPKYDNDFVVTFY